MTSRRFVLIGFITLYSYTVISLCLRQDALYWDSDGRCEVVFAKQLFEYSSSPLDLSVINPYAGMGGMLPPFGVWIHPVYWPFLWDSKLFDPRILSYAIVIVGASLTTYFLGRTLQLPPVLAMIGAQVMAVFLFPPFVTDHFSEMSLATMHALGAVAAFPTLLATLFLLALFRVGVGSIQQTVAAIVALPMIVLYSVLCDSLFSTVLFVPAALLVCGILFGSKNLREFWWRVLGLAICVAVLLMCNVHNYYRALSGYAARQNFPNEVVGEIQRFDFFTAFLFQNVLSAILVVLLIAGCGITSMYGTKQQRWWSISVLGVLLSVTVLSLLYVYGGLRWNKPVPAFFEHGAQHAYIVTLLLGAWISWQRWRAAAVFRSCASWFAARGPNVGRAASYLAAIAIPCGIGLVSLSWTIRSAPKDHSALPVRPIVERLTRELAIAPDGEFRGSVVTVVGVPGGPAASRHGIQDEHAPMTPGMIETRSLHLGLTLERASLWSRRIPTLEEYSQLIPPPMYYVFSRGLSRRQDYQTKNELNVSKVRPNLLGALGARFVLTDFQLQDPRLTPLPPSKNWLGVDLRLYEIARPNVRGVAPNNVVLAKTAKQALNIMLSERFSFHDDVVLFDPLPQDPPLAAVESSALFFERGGVRVKATSNGFSLLVLPLQFSQSLTVVSAMDDSSTSPRLVRCNLVQTGLFFDRRIDVKIANTFGLFRNIEGRLQDIEECDRMKIREDGTVPYPPYYQPHAFLPYLW